VKLQILKEIVLMLKTVDKIIESNMHVKKETSDTMEFLTNNIENIQDTQEQPHQITQTDSSVASAHGTYEDNYMYQNNMWHSPYRQ